MDQIKRLLKALSDAGIAVTEISEVRRLSGMCDLADLVTGADVGYEGNLTISLQVVVPAGSAEKATTEGQAMENPIEDLRKVLGCPSE